MNIEHLREFEYLAENLSFRDTARHFFVSPSVISRHISAMEDKLGTKLFVRSKQSVAITDAGTVFLDRSKAILSEYNAALRRDVAPRRRRKAVVRLGLLAQCGAPVHLAIHIVSEGALPGNRDRVQGHAVQDALHRAR